MLTARRLFTVSALLLLAAGQLPAEAAVTRNVNVGDSFFEPGTIVVGPGDTVLWTQTGTAPHSVTADDDSFDSHPACTTGAAGCMRNGDTYSRAFPSEGTFPYYCKIHGGRGGAGMAGVVQVIDPATAPTTIDQLQASTSGSTVTISGRATFGGLKALEVGTDPAGDGAHGLPAVLGYDLTRASIGQPDASSGDLSFELDLADLPPTGGLSDAAVYFWDLNLVPPGGQPYGFRIMGSLTDLSRVPTPAAESPSFTVRGCGSEAETCTATGAQVDAVMDGDANRITVTVPTDVLAQVTGKPVIGGEIVAGTFGFEGVAVRTDPQTNAIPGPTTDHLTISGSRTVAEREVEVAVVEHGGPAVSATMATPAEDGSFGAELPRPAPGSYLAWARACFGSNCEMRSVPVTID
jgi:plastocyanin